jgi:hypothetical protein
MPRQNRVTPFGEIIAASERGTFMGNRGVLHNADGRITQSRMNKAILCGHRYPSIGDESVQQLRLKLQVNEG